ncbi:hypothetical protein B9Z55_026091 [Caenorhabditis nigoni]|uniref:Uncharacterized protein n=1 Tax=Caenorhabditis nigoni TaxID=1611254 RepID=A0A2G5T206_9PELO|nr:hypothetical protein B9Z55_026091 [Caenorhabditis nigoni]
MFVSIEAITRNTFFVKRIFVKMSQKKKDDRVEVESWELDAMSGWEDNTFFVKRIFVKMSQKKKDDRVEVESWELDAMSGWEDNEEDLPRAGRRVSVTTDKVVRAVRGGTRRNPESSIRKLAHDFKMSRNSMERIVKKRLGLTAYKIVKGAFLTEEIKKLSLEKAKKLLRGTRLGTHMRTLFTDEKIFTVEANKKGQNHLILAEDIEAACRRGKIFNKTSHPASVMAFAGITGNGKTPLVFIGSQNQQRILYQADPRRRGVAMVQISLWKSTLDIPARWAHRAKDTQERCRLYFPEFIQAQEWPTSSPDLNPMDYSVRGYLTQKDEDEEEQRAPPPLSEEEKKKQEEEELKKKMEAEDKPDLENGLCAFMILLDNVVRINRRQLVTYSPEAREFLKLGDFLFDVVEFNDRSLSKEAVTLATTFIHKVQLYDLSQKDVFVKYRTMSYSITAKLIGALIYMLARIKCPRIQPDCFVEAEELIRSYCKDPHWQPVWQSIKETTIQKQYRIDYPGRLPLFEEADFFSNDHYDDGSFLLDTQLFLLSFKELVNSGQLRF